MGATIQVTAAGLLEEPDEPCSVIGWVQNWMGIIEVTEMKLLTHIDSVKT